VPMPSYTRNSIINFRTLYGPYDEPFLLDQNTTFAFIQISEKRQVQNTSCFSTSRLTRFLSFTVTRQLTVTDHWSNKEIPYNRIRDIL
jgi:hypothetical protein